MIIVANCIVKKCYSMPNRVHEYSLGAQLHQEHTVKSMVDPI